MASLIPEQPQLLADPNQPDGEQQKGSVVNKFLVVTLVITAVGLLVSIGCAAFVGLGWRSLRNDESGEGKIDSILTMTGLSHAAFWITVGVGIVLYLLTLVVHWWVSTAEERARTKKRAFKAKALTKS
jgi:ABC-type Fe3+ transport system permease subunit